MKRNAFLANPKRHIIYPNVQNMIIVFITKRFEITMSIQVCLISRRNFIHAESGGKKAFLTNPSVNIVYPNVENMIVMPIAKRMDIVMSIHVCLISQMNFDYMKNGGKKAFLTNPKYQYHVSQ